MVRGHSDWGAMAPVETVAPIADLGEAVVRLGGISSLDRRGNVLWWDGFEDGIGKWTGVGGPIGGSVELSAAVVRNGGFACLIVPGSWAAGGSQLYRWMPLLVESKVGGEISFTVASTLAFWYNTLQFHDGVNRYWFTAKYDHQAGVLYVQTTGGALYEVASGLEVPNIAAQFHTIKLVVDLVEKKYVRLLLDEKEYSLSGVPPEIVALTAYKGLYLLLQADAVSGYNPSIYADDYLLTQNEP